MLILCEDKGSGAICAVLIKINLKSDEFSSTFEKNESFFPCLETKNGLMLCYLMGIMYDLTGKKKKKFGTPQVIVHCF